ncbi:MAG: nitroreductase family protein [Puniceicoccales bacterium]|nr:nitroreductase family protein [Puniceicoccales bacterium]
MEALAARSTSRDFTPDTPGLSQAQLSNLLWATYGVNRPDGRRTAPSANNLKEITVYVLLERGAFLYDAEKHSLKPVVKSPESKKPVGDIRSLAGKQAFAKYAPVTLLMVADFSRRGGAEPDAAARELQGVNAGLIAQNAGLFCASEGLIGGVRMSLPYAELSAALGLPKTHRIVLAYSVGGKN